MSTTTIGATSSDAELVARHRAGDADALADIYDRHAPALHSFAARQLRSEHDAADATHDTFLLAHHRLDQLRDPNRLRPWLFAIARNEVVKRGRARGRVTPTEPTDDLVIDLRDETEGVHRDELRTLLHSAAAGLDDRDRELLELSLHGLEGEELADAMGVGVDHSYVLVKRMRDRVERSLGALLVARRGRKDCDDLQELLRSWDGRYTVKIRKRVARHIDDCDICTRTKLALASPATLLAAAPVLLPPPPSIRIRLLDSLQAGGAPASVEAAEFSGPHGFPAPSKAARFSRRLVAYLGFGALALTIIGLVAWQAGDDLPSDLQVLGQVVEAEATETGSGEDGGGAVDSDEAGPSPSESGSGEAAPPTSPDDTGDAGGGDGGESGAAGSSADEGGAPPAVAAPPSGGDDEGDEGAAVSTTDPTTSTLPPGTTTTDPGSRTPDTTGAPTTDTTAAPPTTPGELVVETLRLDLGIATSGSVRLSNPGGTQVKWQGTGDAPLTVPGTGSVGSGEVSTATVSVANSGQLPEGPTKGEVSFESGGVVTGVIVTYTIARPPAVAGLSASPAEPRANTEACNGGETVRVSARVLDESALGDVVVHWASSGGTGKTVMTGKGEARSATIGPFPAGTVTWSVTAADQWGATATTKGAPIKATPCFTIVLPPSTLVTIPPSTSPIGR